MLEYIDLASCPIDEPCVCVNPDTNYIEPMRNECKRFRDLLYEVFPWVGEVGIEFVVKSCSHDFGTYYEVYACYSSDNDEAMDLAYFIQDNLPLKWTNNTEIEKPVFGY